MNGRSMPPRLSIRIMMWLYVQILRSSSQLYSSLTGITGMEVFFARLLELFLLEGSRDGLPL